MEVICTKCQKNFLKPKIKIRDSIVSFYDYEEIEFLIKYKYHKFGDRVFKILAKNSFKLFANEIKENFFVLPIDDSIKKGFSHTAILANAMKTSYLTPYFQTLLSSNDIKYAGKTLEYRLKNPKNFRYRGKENIDVILVDDIVTTGLTIKQAKDELIRHNVKVYLSIVLCDLKNDK